MGSSGSSLSSDGVIMQHVRFGRILAFLSILVPRCHRRLVKQEGEAECPIAESPGRHPSTSKFQLA